MIKLVIPWLLAKGYTAVAPFPFVIIFKSQEHKNNPVIVNHEMIHQYQMFELLYIPWLILYLFFHLTKGYYNNPFEVEAYKHEKDKKYLKYRKPYSWILNGTNHQDR